MKASLDCIPCLVRQAPDAARMVSPDPHVHRQVVLEMLRRTQEMDMEAPPPIMGQHFHRWLRETTGIADPYRAAKDRFNRQAMSLLPNLRTTVEVAQDPLAMAVRLAIAGNVIDMGTNGKVTGSEVRTSIHEVLGVHLAGLENGFRQAVAEARDILYLADNAGEIAFDRLLIEQLSPACVTLAVRGRPVINDATVADARYVGLHKIVKIINNGSDAPGTILEDCSPDFVRRFTEADLILAKGQGNFETLSDEPRNIFFLFKAKCPVIAAHVGVPIGTYVLTQPCVSLLNSDDSGGSERC